MRARAMIAAVGALAMLAGAAPRDRRAAADDRLVHADREPQNWLTYGGTYAEQHYSPLDAINERTVERLGLAWYADIDVGRGLEATPLVADGVIYLSTAWSTVRAYDARSGTLLWAHDPKVPRDTLVKACCDGINRGVALWDGKVYVGALDGRLIAIDARTGREVWSTQTVDPSQPYTITGAPRVVKGKVLIGNGGAEMGVRGYVSAYDAETGALAWRFYTVPGDPAKPQEQPVLQEALKSWKGDLWWKRGGGGTAWDSIVYDPKLDLVFIGTGNGVPWNQAERSPGGGDNLFLSSIVAVRPETGAYVWHYQETPGETWDYTSTQPIMIADLPIGGTVRHVLLHAPKNGFFYVIDAATGKPLSAKPFVPVNWAKGIDLATGRPIPEPAARYDVTGKPAVVMPGSRGGHNWMPMAFSPTTGLVYIPAQETAELFVPEPGFRMKPLAYNTATDFWGMAPTGAEPLPAVPPSRAYLLAWDPLRQREAWRAPQPAFGGGVLATAGNLVVQGDGRGNLDIRRATDGALLWRMDVQSMAMGGPVSYALDGRQYIAVAVGCGGDYGGPCALVNAEGRQRVQNRLLVLALDGAAKLPPAPARTPVVLDPPPATAPAAQVAKGHALFASYCAICHGGDAVARGLNPDLRASGFLDNDGFFDVVLGGALKDNGMASFAPALDHDDAAAIRAYIVARANADARKGQ